MEDRQIIKEVFSFAWRTLVGFAMFWSIVLMMFVVVSMTWLSLNPDDDNFQVASIGASATPGDNVLIIDNSDSWDVRLELMLKGGAKEAVFLGSSGSTVTACGENLCDDKAGGEIVDTGVPVPQGFSDLKIEDGQVAILNRDGQAVIIPESSLYAVDMGTMDKKDLSIENILTWRIPQLITPTTGAES